MPLSQSGHLTGRFFTAVILLALSGTSLAADIGKQRDRYFEKHASDLIKVISPKYLAVAEHLKNGQSEAAIDQLEQVYPGNDFADLAYLKLSVRSHELAGNSKLERQFRATYNQVYQHLVSNYTGKDLASAFMVTSMDEVYQLLEEMQLNYITHVIFSNRSERGFAWLSAYNPAKARLERLYFSFQRALQHGGIRECVEANIPACLAGNAYMAKNTPDDLFLNSPKADEDIARFYWLAAKGGNAFAQYELARMYITGTIVPANPGLAAAYLSSAARQGFVPAIYQLGRFALDTEELRPLYAKKLLGIASSQGSNNARFHLGKMLLEAGDGESEHGLNQISLAAEDGHKSSIQYLANLYWDGSRVARDRVKACQYLRQGAESNLELTTTFEAENCESMTAEQPIADSSAHGTD